jgi:hypothetical protein
MYKLAASSIVRHPTTRLLFSTLFRAPPPPPPYMADSSPTLNAQSLAASDDAEPVGPMQEAAAESPQPARRRDTFGLIPRDADERADVLAASSVSAASSVIISGCVHKEGRGMFGSIT